MLKIKTNTIKKITARFLLSTFTGVILLFMLSPAVMAADKITCDQLNALDPAPNASEEQKKAAENIKNYIITILEEEIGTGTTGTVTPSESASESLTCFRETTCKTEGEGDKAKTTCTSKYTETCTPGVNKFCQRVQVLVSQSGLDLMMSYLGIVYRWAASVIGVVSVAYLIYGGFLIGTAQDDAGKIDKAKEKIFQSIAGLVLLFLSAIILYTINPNFFTLG